MGMFVRYNKIVGTILLVQLVALLAVAFTMQPLSGDLTRIGGHREGDFGWNAPQERFLKPQFLMARSVKRYKQYYDVVVLGDSFSSDQQKGWENYFVEMTGLSVITFYLADGITISDIVSSSQYRKTPPKIFIYETVERLSLIRFHEMASQSWPLAEVDGNNKKIRNIRVREEEYPKIPFPRKMDVDMEQQLSEAASLIKKSKLRPFGYDNEKTKVYPLDRNDLFSSNKPSSLLVLTVDMEKRSTDGDIAMAAVGLRKARSLVERNGVSNFFVMIFPDKLTAYKEHLLKQPGQMESYIPELAQNYPLPRLDLRFAKALQDGATDLYLPNDTHTGYLGHKVAARAVADFIFQ